MYQLGTVRVQSLDIYNLKNTVHGTPAFHRGPVESDSAVVTGIYGPNGSGKTAVVDAFFILKALLCGSALPEDTASKISVSSVARSARLSARFVYCRGSECDDCDEQWELTYTVDMKADDTDQVQVTAEKLKCKQILPYVKGARLRTVLESSVDGKTPVGPAAVWTRLRARSSRIASSISAEVSLARLQGRSVLFSPKIIDVFADRFRGDILADAMLALTVFAAGRLHVIGKVHAGMIYANKWLPLAFGQKVSVEGGEHVWGGTPLIGIEGNGAVQASHVAQFDRLIDDLNVVLRTLVSDVALKVYWLNPQMEKGTEVVPYDLHTVRNSGDLPLRYESSGIKRLVSVLSLLVAVYNDPTICIVIDELDASIFEYLLGELIAVLADTGCGQLIFTAHDLRTLEVLEPSSSIVTTADPEHRYEMLKNIRPSNNTRDRYLFYLSHDEHFCKPLDRIRIAGAMSGVADAWALQDDRRSSS